MTNEAFKFQSRFLIPELLSFLNRWEDWVELEFTDRTIKEYHFFAIRMLKGAIKPWRSWLNRERPQKEAC